MELFETDILEGRISKYETNHFHMILDGSFELPIDSMKNEDYATFIHEYIHYLQHITTPFGVKICTIYNKMFILYRDYLKTNDTIHLPLELWKEHEGVMKFTQYFKGVKGDKNCCLNIDEVEVCTLKIEEARSTRTAVNIGIYDFENEKAEEIGFKFGYACIIESMAHLIQSFINNDTHHTNIPYHSVELICKNIYEEISEDKKMMISICLCSLMFDNPGVAFFDVVELSKKYKENGLLLYQRIMRDYSVSYNGKQMPMYRLFHKFIDDFKESLGVAIGTELDYYALVVEHCKKEASAGTSVLLDILYNGDITKRESFSEILSNMYGYPFIEANNNSIMPQKPNSDTNGLYLETAAILGLEVILKRVMTEKNSVCSWYEICKKGIYDPLIDCKVTADCANRQWKKTEDCFMTKALDYYRIRHKTYID